MRLISALALLLVISSCAHNKIRKVRVAPRQVVEVNNEQDKSPKRAKAAFEDNANTTASIDEEITEEEQNDATNSNGDAVAQDENNSTSVRPTTPEANDDDEPKISQDAYNEAIRSESHARRAKNSFIASFVIILLPIIGIVLSLIFFGIGWGYLSKASNARFITARGEMYEDTARKLWITYLILAGLVILLLGIAIMLLL